MQSPLAPQDSYFPQLERSNSSFDQRHRFVFSGVLQSGKLSGEGFSRIFLSNWTVAPDRRNRIRQAVPDHHRRRHQLSVGQQFGAPEFGAGERGTLPLRHADCRFKIFAHRISAGALLCPFATPGGPAPTLLALDGTLGRNAGVTPWNVFNDLRISRRIYFGERVNVDLMVDIFNLANKFNVSGVNVLWTNAGQPTAAYDPRQFQFALKVNW